MREEKVGEVRHFWGKPLVAEVVVVETGMRIGDMIHIKGKHTDLTEVLDSMQINHADIAEAKPGDDVGIRVKEKVREGDCVFKVFPD